MNKHILFTGDKCSACDVLKERIFKENIGNRFDFVNVGEHPELAQRYAVRSIPHIVSNRSEHFIGLADGVKFLNRLKTYGG